VPTYRIHDTTGDDLGEIEHPAPNLEPGDVVVVADGREAIVTARVEAEPGWGQLVALLEVAIATSRLEVDDARATPGPVSVRGGGSFIGEVAERLAMPVSRVRESRPVGSRAPVGRRVGKPGWTVSSVRHGNR
jgi:hypothetical protein